MHDKQYSVQELPAEPAATIKVSTRTFILNHKELLIVREEVNRAIEVLELAVVHEGPREVDLRKHESLKNSWEAYLITKKLLGI